MRSMMRLAMLVAIAVLLLPAAFHSTLSVQAEEVEVELGSMDLDKYCRDKYNAGGVKLNEDSAYGWMCKSKSSRGWEYIDMQDVCRKEYKEPKAFAKTSNAKEKYSWMCYIKRTSNSASSNQTLTEPPISGTAGIGTGGNSPSGRHLASCTEDEGWGGTARLTVESVGRRPERYRFTATWEQPTALAFAEYFVRELGEDLDWNKGQMRIWVEGYDKDGRLVSDRYHELKDPRFSLGGSAIAFGEFDAALLGRVGGGHSLKVYAFVKRAGPDLDTCWVTLA